MDRLFRVWPGQAGRAVQRYQRQLAPISGKKSVVGSPAFTRSEPAEAGTRRPTLSASICGFGFNRVIAEAVNNDFRADLAAGVGWRVPVGSHCQVA